MTEIDWNLYSWVARGTQRRKVIEALNKPKIATEIRKETKLSISHVSKVLKSFKEKGIAECLNPETKLGKLYILTEMGKQIREELLREDK